MAHDASQLLGAQQVAGALVNRRGHGWQHAARATGGLAGVAMSYAAGQRASRHTTQTPQFSRTAFVAVTDREVALVKYGPGSRNGGRRQRSGLGHDRPRVLARRVLRVRGVGGGFVGLGVDAHHHRHSRPQQAFAGDGRRHVDAYR